MTSTLLAGESTVPAPLGSPASLFAFFFGPHRCEDCRAMFPIDQLTPIVSETGTWAGFRCGCA